MLIWGTLRPNKVNLFFPSKPLNLLISPLIWESERLCMYPSIPPTTELPPWISASSSPTEHILPPIRPQCEFQ